MKAERFLETSYETIERNSVVFSILDEERGL